ncbi:MAG TPA: hypothetical protein VGC91_00930 [Pyrinomonadaceae bacterium]
MKDESKALNRLPFILHFALRPRLTLAHSSAIKIYRAHAELNGLAGRVFRSSSMAEHPAVRQLQLPQVTVVEKSGEFREAFAGES